VTSEIASAARPTGLRVAGFVCVALGAVLAGVGATREWVTVGFTADTQHAADLSVHGIDVWEGKVVLFAAAAALLVLLAMRISGSPGTRRGLAVVLIVLGTLCIALPVVDAVRARDRFAGSEGLERFVSSLSVKLGLPEDVVRDQLSAQFDKELRVEVSPGLWITVAGGVLLVAGGALSVAWSGRGSATPAASQAA
jgi:Tryptophan-associated transmembrane protein (Trp_oprn_chp)